MAYDIIEGIIQLLQGTAEQWETVSEPIPDGALAYAIDTKVFKLGDGVTTYVNLPVLTDITNIISAEEFHRRFGELTVSESGNMVYVNSGTTGYDYSADKTESTMVTANNAVTALSTKVSVTHDHVGVYLTEDDIKEVVDSTKKLSAEDQDILSYLVIERLATNSLSAEETQKGFADEFVDESYINTGIGNYELENEAIITPGNDFIQVSIGGVARYLACSAYVDGSIYIYGGYCSTGYLNDTWEYNITTGVWTQKSDGPTGRHSHNCVAIGTKIYMYGGYSGPYQNDLWEYETTTDTWTQLTSTGMPAERKHTINHVNGKLYIYGGQNSSTYYDHMVIYDIASDTWEYGTPGPIGIYAPSSAVYGNKIFIIGGSDGTGALATVAVYDTETDTWEDSFVGPTNIFGMTAATIGTKVYINRGPDIIIYDMITRTWEEFVPPNIFVMGGYLCSWSDTRIFYYGGYYDGIYNNKLYEYELPEELSLTSTEAVIVATDIESCRVLVRGSDYGSMNFESKVEVSRDNGVSWAAAMLEKSILAKGDNVVFSGDCTFDSEFLEATYPVADMPIEDVKGSITTFTVDTEDTSGHFDAIAPDLLNGYRITFDDDTYVDIVLITDGGTGADEVRFSGTKATGTYTVASITGLYLDGNGDISLIPRAIDNEIDILITDEPIANRASASVIVDGKLYLHGGYGNNGTTPSFWVYDITNKVWEKLPNPVYSRYLHTLVAVGTKIYTFSGGPITDNDVLEFDTVTQTWTSLPSVGPNARYGYTLEAYNNKLYVFGGYDGSEHKSDMWVYDLSTNLWTEVTGPGFDSRYSKTCMIGNIMYLYGGWNNATGAMGDLWSYDTSTDTWTSVEVGCIAGVRYIHGMCAIGTDIYIGLGSDGSTLYSSIYKYDTTTSTWTEVDALPTAISNQTFVTDGTYIYICGGIDANDDNRRELWRYNTTTGRANLFNRAPECLYIHTATVYDGKVYCIGGYDTIVDVSNDSPNSYIWIYDPTDDTWEHKAKNSGMLGRCYHSASLHDGKIYIHGGSSGATIFNDTWEYTIATHSWRSLPTNTSRWGHESVIIAGVLYVFGGYDGANRVNDLWALDLSTEIWTQLTSGATTRNDFVMVTYGTDIYVHGGFDGTTKLNDLWKYDTLTDTWTQLTSGATIRRRHCGNVYGDKIYISGGYTDGPYCDDVWEYDITAGTWSEVTTNKIYLAQNGTMSIIDGKLYLCGGMYDSVKYYTMHIYDISEDTLYLPKSSSAMVARLRHNLITVNGEMYMLFGHDGTAYTRSMYKYDLTNERWIALSEGPESRGIFDSVVIGTKIYIFSGYGDPYRDDFWEYETTTDTWTELVATPDERMGHAMVAIGTNIYLFSGQNSGGYKDDLWKYDTTISAWTEVTPAVRPPARRRSRAVAHGGMMYMFGGWDGTTAYNDMWRYDPTSNTWIELTSGATGRYGHTAELVGDNIYIMFGNDDTGMLSDIWEYNIITDTWLQITGINSTLFLCKSTVINDEIYVYGGRDVYGTTLNTLYKITPFKDPAGSTITHTAVLGNLNVLYQQNAADHTYTALKVDDTYKVYKGGSWRSIVQLIGGTYYYIDDVDGWNTASVNTAEYAFREALAYEANQMLFNDVYSIDWSILSTLDILGIMVYVQYNDTINDITSSAISPKVFDAGNTLMYRITSSEDISVNGIRISYITN